MSLPVNITPKPEEWEELVRNLPQQLQDDVRRCEERDGYVYITVNVLSTTGPVISIHKPKE